VPIAFVDQPARPSAEKEQGEQALPSLVIYCLGPFRVYQNDQLITDWSSLKGQCILKYLATHRERPVAKDLLMDHFWRDARPEAARRNLHQAIYSLRQTLRRGQPGFQHIRFENDCYLLNPEMDIWLDFEEFEKHVQAGRRLEATGQLAEAMVEYGIAEGLYQGDFLAEDLYEDWPSLRREHIRNMYLDIADRLSEYYVQQGEHTAAVALCQKILARDNCYEGAHRRLMRCYLAQGQRHLAVRQYQTCVEALRAELDLTSSEETVALYRHITSTLWGSVNNRGHR
jgi:DNA-binding SARP family transcriptional activator